MPVTRINSGGAGAVADPPWTEDSPTALSPLTNAKAVGADQVATTTSAVDTSSSSIPAGTPAEIFRDVRVDKGIAKPNLAYVLPVDRRRHLRGAGVLRRGVRGLHRHDQPGAGRLREREARRQRPRRRRGRAGGPLKAFARTYTVTTVDHQPAIQVEVARVRQAPAIAAVELLSPVLEPIDRPGTWVSAGAGPKLGEDAFTGLDGYLYRAGGQIFVAYQAVVSTNPARPVRPAHG